MAAGVRGDMGGRRAIGSPSGGTAHLVYILSDAFRSLRENLATTVLTSITVGFALAIFSLFFLVLSNLNGLIVEWGEKTHIIAYVKDGHSAGDGTALKKSIKGIPGVKGATYISRDAAFEELERELKDHASILKGVDKKALPASVEITVDEDHRSTESLSSMVEAIRKLAWVDEVTYSKEWADRFTSFVNFLELAALVIGAFLAVATLFIISNTIRLTVYARREEIEIMRLVGASDRFIKFPFFIEGVVQGIIGGVVALGFLAAGRALVGLKIPPYLDFALDFPTSVPVFLAFLVAAGMVLGVAGSFISMTRFLKI